MRYLTLGLLALAAGCAHETCPDVLPECPEGTTLTITSRSSTVSQATVDVRPGQADADGISKSEGECTYTCVASSPCPEGTAELYTEDCFTCAPLDEEGLLVEPNDCSPAATEF